jgi:hypothetical protein
MIDVNKDGTIDFNEFLVVVVLMNRVNDLSSRLSFVFDMYGFNIFFPQIDFYIILLSDSDGMNQMMDISIKKN